mgnify:CR=1 FL=1
MNYTEASKIVLEECKTALSRIDPKETNEFIERILDAHQIFCVGVGRVKLSLEAFAKRMRHFGIDIHIVGDITEPAYPRQYCEKSKGAWRNDYSYRFEFKQSDCTHYRSYGTYPSTDEAVSRGRDSLSSANVESI